MDEIKNIIFLYRDLIFLYRVYLIHYIKKFWVGILGFITISLFLLERLMNEMKNNIISSTEYESVQFINYSNLTFLTESLSSKGQEIITLAITNHFLLSCFSGGVILGTILFLSLISAISLVNSIYLIYNYFKNEMEIDQTKLLDIIHEVYQDNKKFYFIDSEDSTKIFLLHLYNLKIIA